MTSSLSNATKPSGLGSFKVDSNFEANDSAIARQFRGCPTGIGTDASAPLINIEIGDGFWDFLHVIR